MKKIILLVLIGCCFINLQALAQGISHDASVKKKRVSGKSKITHPKAVKKKTGVKKKRKDTSWNLHSRRCRMHKKTVAYKSRSTVEIKKKQVLKESKFEKKKAVEKEIGVDGKRMPRDRYAGAMVVSTLLGFGLGSYMENDTTGLIVFSTLDSVFLVGAFTLGMMYYFSADESIDPSDPNTNLNPRSHARNVLFITTLSMASFYGLLRLIEFIYNAAYPFVPPQTYQQRTSASSIAREKYEKSRLAFVLNKMPVPLASPKGVGLSYAYTFKK